MTANLIRLTRGTGKPYEVIDQLNKLIDALGEYREAHGYLPGPEFSDMLVQAVDMDLLSRLDEVNRREYRATHTIVRGALQMAASQMLGQQTQKSAGLSELYDGINNFNDARAEIRAQWAPKFTERKKAAPKLKSPARPAKPRR